MANGAAVSRECDSIDMDLVEPFPAVQDRQRNAADHSMVGFPLALLPVPTLAYYVTSRVIPNVLIVVFGISKQAGQFRF